MSARDKKPVETPAAWLRLADENLAVAEREMASGRPAGYHTVCFLCQSAAEKYLKGYLIAQGWPLEKTHDLVLLLGHCADYEDRFAALREGGAILNEYVIAGRYPGDLAHEEIGETEADEAVAVARRIKEMVKSMIGGEEPRE